MRTANKLLLVFLVLALVVSSVSFAFASGRNFNAQGFNKSGVKVQSEKESRLRKDFRLRIENQNAVENRERVRAKERAFLVSGDLISLSSSEVIVKVKKASKSLSGLIGTEVAFPLGEKTKIKGIKALQIISPIIPDGTKVIVGGKVAFDENGMPTSYKVKSVVVKLPKIVALNGRIVSLSDGGFTMYVNHANKAGRSFINSEVFVRLFEKTKISFPATLTSSLEPGLYVNVIGYTSEGKVAALRVIVKAKPVQAEMTPPSSETTEITPPSDTSTETVNTSGTVNPDETTSNAGSGSTGAGEETTVNSQSGSESGFELTSAFKSFVSYFERLIQSFVSWFRG